MLLVAFALPVSAQSASTTPPDSTQKYWIFFGPEAKAGARSPITLRARERRAQRGTRLPAPELAAEALPFLQRLQITPLVVSHWLNAVSAVLTPAQRQQVRSAALVQSVRPVARLHRAAPPAPSPSPLVSPRATTRYGPSAQQLAAINAIAPLQRGLDGTGVHIGFLDTEFGDFMHPVFDSLRAEGRILGTRNFTGASQPNRHGQSVASVAVGRAPESLVGPAHGAEVLGATTEYAPFERTVEEDFFVAGLEWLEAQGADVVNVSLGYTRFEDGGYTPDDLDGDTGVTTRAVDRAAALGVVVVVSAGNAGGCGTPADCWYFVGTPADADSAITVGAVAPDSSRSFFSSFGPTADGRTKPDVAAPGQSVIVARANGQYGPGSGTSFASPLVAGVAAQILQANPALGPIDVRRLLRETASQSNEPDNALGWGIINADAAVRAAERLRDPPPEEVIASAPFPNPASDRVGFELRMPEGEGRVHLRLFTVLGEHVAHRRFNLQPGTNRIELSTRGLASGLYVYALTGDTWRATGKITVVR